MSKILIIEDDLTFSKIIQNFLIKNGFDVISVHKAQDGIAQIEREKFDLVITDYRLPDDTGMGVLYHIAEKHPGLQVILITNYSDIRTAVKAMKVGAFEYIVKPINPDELLATVKQALKKPANTVVNQASSPSTKKTTPTKGFDYLKGKSPSAVKIQEYIELVAPTNMSVIVQGESGTGKEYVSRLIHLSSKRKDKPFVAIDCGALSKDLAGSELFGHIKGSFTGALDNKIGQFEAANGGTLFLDEIGNLSYDIQIKLLRAIQERKIRKIGSNDDISVDVRIIVATNDDLIESVKQGDFREDLYHRLNEFTIKVPPLRERPEDVEAFALHFLQQSNEELEKEVSGFSAEVKQIFLTYTWPGNLRELKNIVKRATLLTQNGADIHHGVIPVEIANPEPIAISATQTSSAQVIGSDLKATFEHQEKQMIIDTLQQVKFNKSKAAKLLNIDRKTLYNKMEKYGIDG
ncbi:sigma-54-dependent transcriptional regulator [Penaeicola halotolerans]|uniref:sigma-54-dependent transcriptional regulator n=1 Tax=Penaeicola halotolerans TaxID=2793196 RepID=UPI001CF8A60D|nr:sigma-54 dependent transcriptional regulator [Penaeicola halotolerans]